MADADQARALLTEVARDLAQGALAEARERLASVDASALPDALQAVWSCRAAEAALLAGSLDEAQSHAEDAQRLAQAGRSAVSEVTAGALLALTLLRRADTPGLEKASGVLASLEAFRGKVAGEALARLEQAHALVALRQGRLDDARFACFAGIDAASTTGDRWREAQLHDILSSVHVRLGDLHLAVTQIERAIALKREGNDRVGLAISLGNRGRLHMRLGRNNEALRDFRESLALAEEAGDQLGQVVAQDMCGMALMKLGRWGESRAALRTAAHAVPRPGHERHLGLCLKDRAVLEETCGKWRRARRWALCSRRAFQAAGVVDGAGYAAHMIARIAHKMDAADTLDWSRRAVDELADGPRPDLFCESLILHARILEEAGQPAEAAAALTRARDVAATRGLSELLRELRQTSAASDGKTLLIRDETGLGTTERELLLREELEKGGQGRAWRALDVATQRTVVVKERELSAEADKRERELGWWHSELAAAASVDHPNVVRIHGMHRQEGRIHLVMEYLDGGALLDRLAVAPPDVPTAVRWIRLLAEGLAAIHEAGILHRDPSLKNIVFRSNDPVWIDLGLALLPRADRAGAPVGTLGFIPPEVLGEQGFSEASDVYGLAAVSVAILTGEGPYFWPERSNATEILLRVARDRQAHDEMVGSEVPWPTGLPVEVRSLLTRALSYDAADRPSARALAAAARESGAP